MPVWRVPVRNTPKVSPGSIDNVSQNAVVHVNDVRYDKGVETITFYGEVRSAHRASSYSIIVSFLRVKEFQNLSQEEIEQGFNPKPNLSKNEIQIRCSCPSYRFRFDKANRSKRLGTGANFGYYHRLTNRAPNNPKNLPGSCKHVIEFITYLQNQGFII